MMILQNLSEMFLGTKFLKLKIKEETVKFGVGCPQIDSTDWPATGLVY
jgi:hypothetical protein